VCAREGERIPVLGASGLTMASSSHIHYIMSENMADFRLLPLYRWCEGKRWASADSLPCWDLPLSNRVHGVHHEEPRLQPAVCL